MRTMAAGMRTYAALGLLQEGHRGDLAGIGRGAFGAMLLRLRRTLLRLAVSALLRTTLLLVILTAMRRVLAAVLLMTVGFTIAMLMRPLLRPGLGRLVRR